MKTKMETVKFILYSFLVIWILLFIVGIAFTGCSVVRTDISKMNYKKGMVYYYLPQSLIKITSSVKVAVFYDTDNKTLVDGSRIIEQKFVVTTENIADTKEILALAYKPNVLMSDYLFFKVNDNGLLESVKVITDDKTAAIVDKLANAPEQILRIEPGSSRADVTLIIKEYTSDFQIKASEIINKDRTLNWNIIIPNELGKKEYQIVKADFTVRIKGHNPEIQEINQILSTSQSYIEGLLVRPLINADLTISTDLLTGQKQVSEMTVEIIDHKRLINIPIRRTAFAKRDNNIIIQEGVIKSNEITNPSSVDGFVSIPINIAKAIVSIPGQLITFKYDNTVRLKGLEDQKKLLESQLLENEKFQLNRENEINKVLDQIKTEELTRANELNILTFKLQQQLMDAEKNQLKMSNELEELKKEIAKLKK